LAFGERTSDALLIDHIEDSCIITFNHAYDMKETKNGLTGGCSISLSN